MEKQYKLTDRVSKDSLKSPTFKKWLKRVLCLVCIFSLALQLTLCCIPMYASAQENDSIVGTWVFNDNVIVTYDLLQYVNYKIDFTFHNSNNIVRNGNAINITIDSSQPSDTNNVYVGQTVEKITFYLTGGGINIVYKDGSWQSAYDTRNIIEITGGVDINNSIFISWLKANATKVVEQVYDFTGEYRLFNEQLSNLSFAQSGTVTQSYAFDFNIWGGYNADYFHVQADGSSVDISYAFTDHGSGGIKTVYRQLLRDGNIVGTWLVPRARLIYFQSNPEDPTFQQWLLDNTTLIDESMIESVYGFGYDNGYNDGWTNSAIGDTLKAPAEALNSIVLLDIAGTTITLGGVIFTMIVLSIMLIFLKKYAGG